MRKLRIIIFAFLVFGLSMTCHASGTIYTEGALRYTVEDGSVTIVGYFGNSSEVTIPAIISGNPVNTIASGAFVNTKAKTVFLPSTVMTVEEGAFPLGVQVVFDSDTDTPVTVGENSDDETGSIGESGSGSSGSAIGKEPEKQPPIPEKTEEKGAESSITDGTGEETVESAGKTDPESSVTEPEGSSEEPGRQDDTELFQSTGNIWLAIGILVLAIAAVTCFVMKKRKK